MDFKSIPRETGLMIHYDTRVARTTQFCWVAMSVFLIPQPLMITEAAALKAFVVSLTQRIASIVFMKSQDEWIRSAIERHMRLDAAIDPHQMQVYNIEA